MNASNARGMGCLEVVTEMIDLFAFESFIVHVFVYSKIYLVQFLCQIRRLRVIIYFTDLFKN